MGFVMFFLFIVCFLCVVVMCNAGVNDEVKSMFNYAACVLVISLAILIYLAIEKNWVETRDVMIANCLQTYSVESCSTLLKVTDNLYLVAKCIETKSHTVEDCVNLLGSPQKSVR